MFEKIFNLFKRKEETPQFGWEEIKDVLEPYKKTAWFPVIKEKDADTHSSKFSKVSCSHSYNLGGDIHVFSWLHSQQGLRQMLYI